MDGEPINQSDEGNDDTERKEVNETASNPDEVTQEERYIVEERTRKAIVGIVVLSVVVCVSAFLVVMLHDWDTRNNLILICAGARDGNRYDKTKRTVGTLKAKGRNARLVASDGTFDGYERLKRGEVEFVFAQGDIPAPDNARLVAKLDDEAIHLVVKAGKQDENGKINGLAEQIKKANSLEPLRNKVINLSGIDSGTRITAVKILKKFKIYYGKDFKAGHLKYEQILKLEANSQKMPDAFFIVSLIPARTVEHLITNCGYVLADIPIKSAAIANNETEKNDLIDKIIDARKYGGNQTESISTLAIPLKLVSHSNVTKEAVRLVCETLYDDQKNNGVKFNKQDEITEPPLHDAVKEFDNGNGRHTNWTSILRDGTSNLAMMITVLGSIADILALWWILKQNRPVTETTAPSKPHGIS